MTKSFIYASDIHGNIEALKQLNKLPEMSDPNVQFRFGGDYSDGFDLIPNAIKDTWNFIMELCQSGKAKAILGNHDEWVIDAAYQPHKYTWWEHNGRQNTLENLNIPFVNENELREQLLYHFYDQMEWLKTLPFYLEDGKNILVHAGFDLDRSLEKQNTQAMLWTREPYILAMNHMTLDDIHRDFHDKTIITGHTPTINLEIVNETNDKPVEVDYFRKKDHCPIILDTTYIKRYFIDGGSKSGLPKARINLLKLDENGNELWRKYATKDGIFNYK